MILQNLKRATVIIENVKDNETYYYFFESGDIILGCELAFCFRPWDVTNSYIEINTEEAMRQEIEDMMQTEIFNPGKYIIVKTDPILTQWMIDDKKRRKDDDK